MNLIIGGIIAIVIVFIVSLMLLQIFSPSVDKKLVRAIILAILFVSVNFMGRLFNIYGLLISLVVNFLIVKVVLDYEFLSAFYFFIAM